MPNYRYRESMPQDKTIKICLNGSNGALKFIVF